MIKYYCDMCKEEPEDHHYYSMPMMNKNGKFKSVSLHLCNACCNKIELFIRELIEPEMEERLNNLVDNCTNDSDWCQGGF